MSFYDTVREAYHSEATYADTDSVYYPIYKFSDIIDKRFTFKIQDKDAGRFYDLYSRMITEQNETRRLWIKTHLNAVYGKMVTEEIVNKNGNYYNYWHYPPFGEPLNANAVVKYCENDAKIVEETYKEIKKMNRREFIVVHHYSNEENVIIIRKSAIVSVTVDDENCCVVRTENYEYYVKESYAEVVKRLFE